MTKYRTFRDILAALGKPRAVSDQLPDQIYPGLISTWIFRDTLPEEWWADIEDLAIELGIEGITCRRLAEIAREKHSLTEEVA
jgi:hypothetical protein